MFQEDILVKYESQIQDLFDIRCSFVERDENSLLPVGIISFLTTISRFIYQDTYIFRLKIYYIQILYHVGICRWYRDTYLSIKIYSISRFIPYIY